MRLIDLTGKVFGGWTVISRAENNKYNHILWKCICTCGTIKKINGGSLRGRRTTNCGCIKAASNTVNILGQVFGRLTVISREGSIGDSAAWRCKCECGNESVTSSKNLRQGATKSCGCLAAEAGRANPICQPRLPPGEAGFNGFFETTKKKAKGRSLSFELSKEQVRNLSKQCCNYCGELPKQIIGTGHGTYIYNGIDRVDNDLGYTESNSVACCGICNRAKLDRDLDDFEAWIVRVFKYKRQKEV